ncbi:hypothetical protein KCP78_17085 [Salmonella enterica subsp. enterica]|nr:hypothetical protein KCP78_17085 [Salmonella enterica subsp. enterica]
MGDVTTLSGSLSVAALPHARRVLTSGALTDALLDLELSALGKSSSWILCASPGCWLPICSQPVSAKAAKFLIRFSSGESGATSVEFKEALPGRAFYKRAHPPEIYISARMFPGPRVL